MAFIVFDRQLALKVGSETIIDMESEKDPQLWVPFWTHYAWHQDGVYRDLGEAF